MSYGCCYRDDGSWATAWPLVNRRWRPITKDDTCVPHISLERASKENACKHRGSRGTSSHYTPPDDHLPISFSSFFTKTVSDHYKFRLILALQGLFSRLRYHLVMSMCLEFLYLTSFFFNHATKRNSLFFFSPFPSCTTFCFARHLMIHFSGWPHTHTHLLKWHYITAAAHFTRRRTMVNSVLFCSIIPRRRTDGEDYQVEDGRDRGHRKKKFQ